MGNKLMSLVLHLLLLSGICGAQQKPFTLDGTIPGKTGAYIYLSYPEDAATNKKDSSLIENGQFSFKGTLYGPAAQATLSMDRKISSSSNKIIKIFLVPGNMQLSLDYNNFGESAVLKGSPVQAEAEALEKSKATITAQLQLINDAYEKAYALYKEAVKAKKDEAVLDCLKEAADLVKEAMYPLGKQAAKIDLASRSDNSSSINNHYGISTLPTKILIDSQGIIIGRYGNDGESDEALDKKLAGLFGKLN